MVGVIIIINFLLISHLIIIILYDDATGSGPPVRATPPPPNRHGPWTKKVTHDASTVTNDRFIQRTIIRIVPE